MLILNPPIGDRTGTKATRSTLPSPLKSALLIPKLPELRKLFPKLHIDVDTSAITRSLGEIPRIAQRSQAAMTSAVRAGGRQRLTLDQQFTREHEAISVRLARAKERRAKEETDKLKAEERKRVQADGEFARLKDGIHAQLVRAKEQREKAATRVEEAEGRRRLAVDRQFNREKDRAHAAMIRCGPERPPLCRQQVHHICLDLPGETGPGPRLGVTHLRKEEGLQRSIQCELGL